MRIDRVTFEGKYSVNTQFLDVVLGAEGFLDEGQTMEQGHRELKDRVDAFVASLKKSSAYFTPAPETLAEKNIAYEKMEIAFDNAKTVKELQQVEYDLKIKIPNHLMTTYAKKLSELCRNKPETLPVINVNDR